jgi:hypothetical protein
MKIVKVELRPIQNSKALPRMYFWPKGETIAANMAHRRSRPYNEYRKLIPAVLKRVFDLPQTYTAQWSQHAGCHSCPCSPGFIMKGLTGNEYDIHVTIR